MSRNERRGRAPPARTARSSTDSGWGHRGVRGRGGQSIGHYFPPGISYISEIIKCFITLRTLVLGTEFEIGECLVWWNWFSTPSIDIQTGRAARPAELQNERVTPATRHGLHI